VTQVVVDTDVVSFLFKNHPIGQLYDSDLVDQVALISFMTLAEIHRWAIQSNWGSQRLKWLDLHLKRFTIVPSSPELCQKWAAVTVTARATGRRIECADAWIAATAVLYDVPLITHNRNDFLGVPGLRLISHT
jgi:tRNA(fMet)-specific endonuclease VapC